MASGCAFRIQRGHRQSDSHYGSLRHSDSQHADVDRHRDRHGDCHADSYSDAIANALRDSDSRAHDHDSHLNADDLDEPDSKSDFEQNANASQHPDANANSSPIFDADAHPNFHDDANADPLGELDSNPNTDSDLHSLLHTDTNSYTDCYANSDSNSLPWTMRPGPEPLLRYPPGV